jgi:hypothetical protein
MRAKLWTFIVGTLVVAQGAVLAAAQSCNDSACLQGTKWIVDTPNGKEDGINLVFELTSAPISSLEVEVFRNGLRLRDQDFSEDGKTLRFSPAQTPQPGDTLVAEYFAKPTRGTVLLDTHSPEVSKGNRNFQDETTIAAGREALALEERRITDASNMTVVAVTHGNAMSGASSPRSVAVRMLVNRAQNGDTVPPVDVRTGYSGDAEGVDGLGDYQPMQVARQRGMDPALPDGFQDKDAQRVPASVRMIIRKDASRSPEVTNSNDSEDGSTGKRAKKHHGFLHDTLQTIAR